MPASTTARRAWTVASANSALPEVRRLLAELRRAVDGLDEIKARLVPGADADAEVEVPKPGTDSHVDPEHFQFIALFHHSLGRFAELGIEVKDVQKGLIDFPCRAGGEEVLLCWQEGEEQVRFFHDRASGFEGRKPVDELPGAGILPQPPDDEEEG